MKAFLALLISTALLLLFFQTGLTLSAQQTPPAAPKPQPGIEVREPDPLCYMETPNSTIVNLAKLCQQPPNPSASADPPEPTVYNESEITKFDNGLYGPDGN
jgi:hypothetical protein